MMTGKTLGFLLVGIIGLTQTAVGLGVDDPHLSVTATHQPASNRSAHEDQNYGSSDAWARFRGNSGSASVDELNIPLEWSSDKNLKWKFEIPGPGSSSPIVHGDRVYITCYTGYGVQPDNPGDKKDLVRHLIAVNRNNGQPIWRQSVAAAGKCDPYKGFITQHGYASTTPTTDGEHVWVVFGKSGLFCYDLDGNQVWTADLGDKSDPAKWGDSSSPILYKDLVIVNAGILGHQLIAFNKKTGKEVWSIQDSKFTNSWSTPTIANTEFGDQLLFGLPSQIVSVNPETGKENWRTTTPLNDSTCACIVSENGRAFCMGTREGRGMGIECGADQATEIWKGSVRSGIDTPLLKDGLLYWHSRAILYVADAETGEYVYKQRLPQSGKGTAFPNVDYSSPVSAGNYLIQFLRNGESFVVKTGREFELAHHNPAFDGDTSGFSSTPAISGGGLFIRSNKFLYAIGK